MKNTISDRCSTVMVGLALDWISPLRTVHCSGDKLCGRKAFALLFFLLLNSNFQIIFHSKNIFDKF